MFVLSNVAIVSALFICWSICNVKKYIFDRKSLNFFYKKLKDFNEKLDLNTKDISIVDSDCLF